MIALRRLLVINVDDPLAASLHNVADVEEHCPGVVSGVREWFRWYKTPDDKPINAIELAPSRGAAAAAAPAASTRRMPGAPRSGGIVPH